jgi:hypothetical protein
MVTFYFRVSYMPRAMDRSEFVKYHKGSASIKEINSAITAVWSEIIQDPEARREAETLLGLKQGSLIDSNSAPFVGQVEGSGLSGAEAVALLILWDFAKDLGYDLAKDATKQVVVRGAKALWVGLMGPRVEQELPADAVGKEIRLHDDLQ